MTKILSILPAGTWNLADAIDHIDLDFDQRYRRRHVLQTPAGSNLLLDLPTATRLRHNDGLVTQNGIIHVRASPEPLLQITAPNAHLLIRAAWHLGNRHLPVQFEAETLLIRTDHVISTMLENLGCTIHPIQSPFDPEPGAYAAPTPHHHHDH
jgi:urease accessory protein